MYLDIKEFKFKLESKAGGSTMCSSYGGSVGSRRPQSEFEAQQMVMEWLQNRYPDMKVVDLKITYK